MTISPNPSKSGKVRINFIMPYVTTVDYFVSSLEGKIISDGEISEAKQGENGMNFVLEGISNQVVIITFIFDNKFYVSQKVVVN